MPPVPQASWNCWAASKLLMSLVKDVLLDVLRILITIFPARP